MTATKTTKIAALVTAICLILSSVMMLGKTYAWFTDEAKSGDNVITSGTLDIEMSYSDKIDGTYTNVEGEGVDPIFSYDLWEPGYTQVRYIKIANNGNLALKYKLTLTTDETATLVDNEEVKLSEVIDVYVGTSEVKSRGDLVNMKKVGTLADLIADEDGAAYGIMLPAKGAADVELNPEDAHLVTTGAQTYCVVLHMQEDAGNEYQNLSVGTGIDVLLYADQYTWENDSFDNTYDELAGMPVADVKGESPEVITATWGMGGELTDLSLDTAFVFRTTETAEEAAAGEQAYWHVDFVVSADKDVPANSIALAGYYEAYCEGYNGGHWVALKSDEDIKAGDEIRLLEAMLTGGSMSYQELCNWVPVFKCGAVDLTGENNVTTLTVELRMYEMKKNAASTDEETGKYYTIGTYSYTFGANTPEKLAAALAAMSDGGEVLLTGDVNLNDAPIAVAKDADVTLDLNGHTLSGVSTSDTTSNLIKVNAGAKLTIKNGTVSFGATTPDTNWGGEGQPAFPDQQIDDQDHDRHHGKKDHAVEDAGQAYGFIVNL